MSGEPREDVRAPEKGGKADADVSGRDGVPDVEQGFHVADFFEDPSGVFVVKTSGFCRNQFSGRSGQQAGVQAFFQGKKVSADRRDRGLQCFRRG